MSDVTVKTIDDLESYEGSMGPSKQFFYAGKGLGVTAWGMNLLKFPPNYTDYPEHDHSEMFPDGQEEVYVVLEGSATLQAGEDSYELKPGTMARVAPMQKRKILPGDEGVTILALGGTPGKAFESSMG